MTDSKDKRPETPKTIISNLPPALCDKGLFCNWKYTWNEEKKKWDKMPYNPGNILRRAHTNDPATFSSLEKAARNQNKIPGVGVGIFDTIGAIDIDGCISSEGEISKGAADIVAIMSSYTEKTPSGTGLRILFTVPEDFKYDLNIYSIEKQDKKAEHRGIEVYLPAMTRKFLTLTGHYVGERKDLEERPEQLQIVLDKYMKKTEPPKVERKEPAAPLCLSDQEIIDRIRHSTEESKFSELWDGNWEPWGSQSQADNSLCSILAFWTQCNPDQMERIFMQSGLNNRRKSQERADYVPRTVKRAIEQCTVVYDPEYYKPGDELTDADREGLRKMLENHKAQQTEAIESPNLNDTNASGQNTVEDSKIEIRANNGLTEAKEAEGDTKGATEATPENATGTEEEKEPAAIFRPYIVGDYISGGTFEKDINYFKAYKDRKTGFKNIDKYLTLYPGLMTLAGAASIGKSTFAVNLADNLVMRGETVLYFAMEQTAIELTTKSLARRLIEKDPFTRLTNIEIKNGATSDALEKVKKEYAEEIGDRFIIIRCDFTTTAQQISDYVEAYIKETGRKPCIIIDYLQLISPPAPPFKGDVRAAIDENIKTLKRLQLNNELFVLMLSNINRASYETPPSYEDFKESSMIEFTSDFMAEIQPSIMETDYYYTVEYTNSKGRKVTRDTTKREKNKMLDEALSMRQDPIVKTWKRYQPIDCEIVFLKNRNGRQRFKSFFRYDRQYDIFTEADAREWMDTPQEGEEAPQEEIPGLSVANNEETGDGLDKYGISFT